jgi:hypothetical protein
MSPPARMQTPPPSARTRLGPARGLHLDLAEPLLQLDPVRRRRRRRRPQALDLRLGLRGPRPAGPHRPPPRLGGRLLARGWALTAPGLGPVAAPPPPILPAPACRGQWEEVGGPCMVYCMVYCARLLHLLTLACSIPPLAPPISPPPCPFPSPRHTGPGPHRASSRSARGAIPLSCPCRPRAPSQPAPRAERVTRKLSDTGPGLSLSESRASLGRVRVRRKDGGGPARGRGGVV